MSHITIKNNPSLEGMAEIIHDITFSDGSEGKGEKQSELKLQIINPWWDRVNGDTPSYPLVVFVQGSGWTFPNVWMEVPQLCELVKKGYVVATITHRNCNEGYPFPACLKDVKTAIRFLRCNGREYGIDTEKIGIWGTSSGGNLALLTALTIGDERYVTDEYKEYSDKVDYCIACFPPTDLVESMKDENFNSDLKSNFLALSGGHIDENMSVLREMSPYHIVMDMINEKRDVKLPPFLIAHGDSDRLIPYNQGKKMYDALMELNAKADMVTVEGADHEGTFWSREILDIIFDFIENWR